MEIANDITHIKKKDESLRISNETKDTLMLEMNHRIKNNLLMTTVKAYSCVVTKTQ